MRFLKILIILLGCFWLCGCMQEPTVNYKDSLIQLNSLESASAKFNFDLHNPNAFPLNGKAEYAVFIEDKEFTSGQSQAIDAAANADTDFSVEQNIDFAKVFGSAADLFKAVLDGQESIQVRVNGQLALKTLGIFDVPIRFDQTVDVPLPTKAQVEEQFRKSLEQSLKQNTLPNLDLKDLEDFLKNL
jgi:LEA14-like dessication related protein